MFNDYGRFATKKHYFADIVYVVRRSETEPNCPAKSLAGETEFSACQIVSVVGVKRSATTLQWGEKRCGIRDSGIWRDIDE